MIARPAERPGGGALLAVLLVALAWVVAHAGEPAPRQAQGNAISGPSSGSPAGLSFTDQAGCRAAGDWRSARLDRRVRQLLERAAKQHRIRVSCLRTGHSWYVAGTTRVSNHSVWRAVDVDQVDGHPVSPSNPAARELAGWIGQGGAGVWPSEVGSPWAFGRRPWFSDEGHQDHLHVGFAGPTRAGGR